MATKGEYVKPAPIGSNVITTDDVIAAGHDFVYLKMGGMLKVQGATVEDDLTVKGDTPFSIVPLVFSTNLANQAVNEGANATFTVAVSGGIAPYTYEWFYAVQTADYPVAGVKIDPSKNATARTASLVNSAVTQESAGVYYAVVRDSADNVLVSAPSMLTVSEVPLAFTTNLTATKTVATGAALNMPVVVTGGKTPYAYVWKKDGTVVSGQTSATFNKASAVSGDAGVYTCEVTDAGGTKITSTSCTVTVS